MLPSEIREVAINLIRQQPQGKPLKELVDEILVTYDKELSSYGDPEAKVRNAIWNLDEKFPHLVTKSNLSGRKAVMIPKETGAPRSKGRSVGIVREEPAAYNTSSNKNLNVVESAWALLTAIEVGIEEFEHLAEVVENVSPQELGSLGIDDMNTVIELRSILIAIKNCRKTIIDRQEKE